MRCQRIAGRISQRAREHNSLAPVRGSARVSAAAVARGACRARRGRDGVIDAAFDGRGRSRAARQRPGSDDRRAIDR
jgi:hypothetical protein